MTRIYTFNYSKSETCLGFFYNELNLYNDIIRAAINPSGSTQKAGITFLKAKSLIPKELIEINIVTIADAR